MTIDPKWAFILNIAALVLSAFAGAAWVSDVVGPKTATVMLGILNTLVTAINAVLSAYSSPKAGPMVKL